MSAGSNLCRSDLVLADSCEPVVATVRLDDRVATRDYDAGLIPLRIRIRVDAEKNNIQRAAIRCDSILTFRQPGGA